MKKKYLFGVILCSAIACTGCSSAPTSNSPAARNTAVPEAANSNAAVSAANLPPGISGPAQSSNIDKNAPSTGPFAMANKRPIVEGPGPPPGVTQQERTAPENSSVTVAMTKDGNFVETRVFRTDRHIAKVVKISNGSRQTAAIYLKNGRYVQVPADKIPVIHEISLAALKGLAGIKESPPQAGKRDKADEAEKRAKQ
jgi:hypothetical protein